MSTLIILKDLKEYLKNKFHLFNSKYDVLPHIHRIVGIEWKIKFLPFNQIVNSAILSMHLS